MGDGGIGDCGCALPKVHAGDCPVHGAVANGKLTKAGAAHVSAAVCDGAGNVAYANPEVDKLFDAGKSTVDLNQRTKSYKQAEALLAKDLPEIPLYQAVDVEAYNKKLAGYKGNEFWWMNQTADWYINQ